MILNLDSAKLVSAIDRFSQFTILVLGDLMLDRYISGNVKRISQEAPVPVVDVIEETRMLGGAANAAYNIISVGGKVKTHGILGTDPAGDDVRKIFTDLGSSTDGILDDSSRPTTIKTRIISQGQQMIRFDKEVRKEIGPALIETMSKSLFSQAGKIDAIIISDYGKGVITPEIMDAVRKIKEETDVIVTVDPYAGSFKHYHGVTSITPNQFEVLEGAAALLLPGDNLTDLGQEILKKLDLESLLITRGKKGMVLLSRDETPYTIPARARDVYDASGAGDTSIVIYTMGIAAGLKPLEAAYLANIAGGIVAGKSLIAPVKTTELKDAIMEIH